MDIRARRATQAPGLRPLKAHPSTPHPARPYGLDGHTPKNLPVTDLVCAPTRECNSPEMKTHLQNALFLHTTSRLERGVPAGVRLV